LKSESSLTRFAEYRLMDYKFPARYPDYHYYAQTLYTLTVPHYHENHPDVTKIYCKDIPQYLHLPP